MENKPLSQEDKMKEFLQAQLIKFRSKLDHGIPEIIEASIQFGSELRAERTKEMIEALKDVVYYHEQINGAIEKDEVLQAIKESKI